MAHPGMRVVRYIGPSPSQASPYPERHTALHDHEDAAGFPETSGLQEGGWGGRSTGGSGLCELPLTTLPDEHSSRCQLWHWLNKEC